jgi:hypothetical protein
MMPHGPVYCETGHPWLFMAEPVNTITNAFIILSAILAFRQVQKARIGWPAELTILLFLLFATGVGSFAWHAFRTRTALAFDAIPGLLFLFVFTGFWVRRLLGAGPAILAVAGLIAAAVGSIWLAASLIPGFRALPPALTLLPAYAAISALGVALVIVSASRLGVGPARTVSIALICAVAAAICRSVDLAACRVVPFGTHFLWHILLSLAAYLAISMLVRVRLQAKVAG